MGLLDLLAESKIREWQQQDQEAATKTPPPSVTRLGESLESQLYHDLLTLYQQADSSSDDTERRLFLQKATELQTRLMIILENSGRSLTARALEKALLNREPVPLWPHGPT